MKKDDGYMIELYIYIYIYIGNHVPVGRVLFIMSYHVAPTIQHIYYIYIYIVHLRMKRKKYYQ